VNVLSNAVLSFTGNGFSQTSTGMGRFVVNGASLMFTNSAALPGNSDAFIATSPDIYVTNGTVLVELGKFFKISGGNLTLANSTFRADNLGLINSPVLDFIGSDLIVTNKGYFGYNTSSRPVVNLRGGKFEFAVQMVVGESATSDATLNLLEGVESAGYRLMMGDALNATGTVNIASGNLVLSENIIIGNKGSGTVNVSGGTNSCWKILLCNNKDSASQKALYNQTGGRVEVKSEFVALPVANVSGSTATVRLNGGVLVADTVVDAVVGKALQKDGVVMFLDGYPRTSKQLSYLETILRDAGYVVISIKRNTPEELILERVSKRRVCKDCKCTHSVDDGKCPKCGGESVVRRDDAVIEKRLSEYQKNTSGLWDNLKDVSNVMVTVDGSEDAFKSAETIVDDLRFIRII
jgi:adenylate kinase